MTIQSREFSLPELSRVDFSVTYADLNAASPLNQNEAHIHNRCEIYINLSGDVSFEVENHIYPVTRGSVIITRPFEYHHCIYHSNRQHRHFWITFSAAEDDAFLRLFFGREKGKNNLIRLDEELLGTCCRVLEDLLEGGKDPLLRRIGFLQLLNVLRSGSSENSTHEGEKLPPDVLAALLYMDEHLTEELDVKTLSAACCVSAHTLERHFREALGTVPFAMLRKKKLFASMAFLRNGDTVTEAALKSGFSDYSHYIQLFRKEFGITPLQYKKQFQTG